MGLDQSSPWLLAITLATANVLAKDLGIRFQETAFLSGYASLTTTRW